MLGKLPLLSKRDVNITESQFERPHRKRDDPKKSEMISHLSPGESVHQIQRKEITRTMPLPVVASGIITKHAQIASNGVILLKAP